MSDLEVRIEQMEPMRVASAHGFGTNPEEQAWNKILAFAEAKGIDPDCPLDKSGHLGYNLSR
jgi:hypothetical protein